MSKKNFKQQAISKLLDNNSFVMAHINTATEGVIIPAHLYHSPTVTLKLSRQFMGPLKVTETSLVAQLLFGSERFTCQLPFESIWAIGTPDGAVQFWSDSSPTELLERFIGTQQPPAQESPEENKSKHKANLRRVK